MKFTAAFLFFLLIAACAGPTTDKVSSKKNDVSRVYNANRAQEYPHAVGANKNSPSIAQTIDDYRIDDDTDDQLFAEDSYLPYLHTNVPEDRNTRGHIFGSSSSDSLQNGDSGKKVYFLYGAEHLNLQNYYFDIPVVYNDQVKKWMNYFLGRGKEFFIRYSERAGRYAPTLG